MEDGVLARPRAASTSPVVSRRPPVRGRAGPPNTWTRPDGRSSGSPEGGAFEAPAVSSLPSFKGQRRTTGIPRPGQLLVRQRREDLTAVTLERQQG